MSFKYDAFISYARSSDQEFAPAIHSSLQRFARSWTLKPALRIFLDKASLSGSPSLSKAIEIGLNESAWLLLLASKESANSDWVHHEINWWIEHKRLSKLLILLTNGEIAWDNTKKDFDWTKTTALPRVLQGHMVDEPLYVDLRKVKEVGQFTLRSLVFRDAIATIAAPLHNKSKDELDGEDIRQFRKFIGIRRIAVSLLISSALSLIALSGWSAMQGHEAIQNQIDATVNAAENALNADMQIEAMVAATKSGQELLATNSTLNRIASILLNDQKNNEIYAKVVSRLLQGLDIFHEQNRLLGHTNEVSTVAISPDCSDGSQFILSGGRDGRVILWMREQLTGGKLGGLNPSTVDYKDKITDGNFSPDCKEFAASGLENSIKIWKIDGSLVNTLNTNATIKKLQYSSDGQLLVSGDEYGNLVIWDSSGNKIQSIDAFDGVRIVDMKLRSCPNGDQLLVSASANAGAPLKLWKLNHEHRLMPNNFPGSGIGVLVKGHITSTSISLDCTLVAVGDDMGNISLFQLNGVMNKTWQAHDGPVTSIDFSRNSQFLVSGGETDISKARLKNGNDVKLWTVTGEAVATYKGHRGKVTEVVFSNDSQTVVSASADKSIRIWNINSPPVVEKQFWGNSTINARISPDGNLVAGILTDKKIEILNLLTKNRKLLPNETGTLDPYFGANDAVYFLDNSHNTLNTSSDANANLISGYRDEVKSIKFNPDGKSIALINPEGSLRLWDLATKKPTLMDAINSTEQTLAFSPDGKILAAVSTKAIIPVIKLLSANGNISEFPIGSQDGITQIVFSPDGKTIAVTGRDRQIKLWNIKGQEIGTLIGHDSEVINIAFHPEGKMLASSDFDGSIIIWSLNSENLARFNSDSKKNIWALNFTRDGKWLVAASMDSVTRWKVDLPELVQLACRTLRAYLKTNPIVSAEDKKLCQGY